MKIKKYLNTKTFSKILAFGILLNNVSINSFAGILSEDGRYETFEGSDITIPDILEEDKVDVEIEGNTLVNVLRDVTLINNTNTTTINDDGSISFLHNSFQTTRSSIRFQDAIVEPNKTYTLMFNIVENTLSNSAYNSVAKFNIVNYNYGVHFIRQGDIGIQKVVLKQPDYITFDGKPYLEIHDDTLGRLVIKDIMLLEGDFSNTNISFFEGIKSVGQDDKNGHKIEVSSLKGKPNLLKNSGFLEGLRHFVLYNGAIGEIVNDDTALSKKALKITTTKSYSGAFVFNPIGNIENKRYTLTGYCKGEAGKKMYVTLEGHKETIIDFTDNNWVRFSVISELNPVNWNKNITFYNLSGEGQVFYLKDLKLEISETPTPYIPHYTESNYNSFVNRKEILLNEPLRALPNGIKDRIIKRNGQWIVERNCGEIVLDGSENWGLFTKDYSGLSNYQYLVDDIIPQGAKSGYNISISDKFMWGTVSDNPVVEDYEHHRIQGIDNAKRVYLWLNKNTAPTVEELKNWLRNNNVRIVYQLETPTYKPLNIDSTINTYLDTTHISTNSIIPANLKVTVDRVANKAKEYSELAKENPTIENISLARMWTNKMRESILKDEFQDSVDSITEITDMTLERKTASSNIDVYIKSENMLSMNLSTNSITFEDFSGVEDMVKENAVNISINSSLPYNLNAYLATDIQNSDKSNVMNKDILSIKDNSELNYQTFNSINDKVVLKSNCNSGNDKQHDIDLKLNGGIAHEKDVYKATIKFEAQQQ